MFYIENGRPAAELAAAIWLTYRRKYKKSLPVKVTEEISYSRPGVKEGTEKKDALPVDMFCLSCILVWLRWKVDLKFEALW